MDKKSPLRMCIVCKNMIDKRNLMRVVKNKDGNIHIDLSGKANGRGAYVCGNDECMAKLVKTRALNRAFKFNVDQSVYDEIIGEYERNKNN